jgi:hypothetical protein
MREYKSNFLYLDNNLSSIPSNEQTTNGVLSEENVCKRLSY